MPSAQAVSSSLQLAEQPSPLAVLPSSHCSPSRVISTVSPHLPAVQVPEKQMLVGPQLVLSSTLTWAQPVCGLQESMVHGLLSSQDSGGGAHTPPEQTSGPLQALPSLHGALLAVCWQPLTGSHESLVHNCPSSQARLGPATQLPLWQLSPAVHREASASQLEPFIAPPLNTQSPVVVLQLSAVHKLPSLQVFPVPLTQAPLAHLSPWVQAFPSLQLAVLATYLQPNVGSQLSSVQALLSLHTTLAPTWQLVPTHLSPLVHTEPSASHGAPLFCAT